MKTIITLNKPITKRKQKGHMKRNPKTASIWGTSNYLVVGDQRPKQLVTGLRNLAEDLESLIKAHPKGRLRATKEWVEFVIAVDLPARREPIDPLDRCNFD